MPKRRLFPRPLAECIHSATAPALGGKGALMGRILRDWRQIAGGETAALATPHALNFPRQQASEGTLTLRVAPAHALEVQYMEPVLLNRLSAYLGYRAVSRIKLEHAPHEAPPPPAKPSVPADETSCVNVGDEEIRNALTRLARALQKGA